MAFMVAIGEAFGWAVVRITATDLLRLRQVEGKQVNQIGQEYPASTILSKSFRKRLTKRTGCG